MELDASTVGEFSGVANGYMDCPGAKGVPLSISIR